MKARVDAAKCNGYTLCNQIAPALFGLDEWGYAYVASDVLPDREELAREAAEACPERAIILEE